MQQKREKTITRQKRAEWNNNASKGGYVDGIDYLAKSGEVATDKNRYRAQEKVEIPRNLFL